MPDSGETPNVTPPSGLVTFIFTDVEGSSRLWAADTDATSESLRLHDTIVKDVVAAHQGYLFGWAGDHFRAAFSDPNDAVHAADLIQRELEAADWGEGPALRVRIGVHRGRATQRDGDYFGPVPNAASRVEALGHGGQTLLTGAVASEVQIPTLYLGDYRLRDVPEPVEIYQIGTQAHRPLRAIDPTLTTLPAAGSAIVGRDEAIYEIRGLFDSSSMVTLTGVGGSGKTRLAVEVGYQELPSRSDGCYFADLSAVSESEELLPAIARAVRLEISGAIPISEQVIGYLADRDALLILDNCEHLVEACADFAEGLLARSSSTVLLATTRQRLGVSGEVIIPVAPLDYRDADSPAIEFFMQRASEASSDFVATEADRFVIGEICARLDGIPLAIELAAGRISVLTPAEILERMADRFRLLSGGSGRHRRRTLQATLDWSYDLLAPAEQDFFAKLGLFVGYFDLAAAAAVAGVDEYEAMDLLTSLSAKNLIVAEADRTGTAKRYRMLETVRIYAGDQLARADFAVEAQDAYTSYYFDAVHTYCYETAGNLVRAEKLEWLWPNITAAFEQLVHEERWVDAGWLCFGCLGLWESHIPGSESRRWLERVLPAINELCDRGYGNAESNAELRDWLEFMLAAVVMQVDDFSVTFALMEGMMSREDAAPEPAAKSAAFFAYLLSRQFQDRVPALVERSKQLVAEHGLDEVNLTPAYWAHGCLMLYTARFADAEHDLEIAHRLLESRPETSTEHVVCALSLAATKIMVGEPAAALDVIDSTEFASSIWDSSAMIRAVALIELDRIPEAVDGVIEYSLNALLGRLARVSNEALVGFAALAQHKGDHDHCWTLLQQAMPPRTPFTIVLAEWLASRMGRGDELRSMHRDRVAPLTQFDASVALGNELARLRSYSESSEASSLM